MATDNVISARDETEVNDDYTCKKSCHLQQSCRLRKPFINIIFYCKPMHAFEIIIKITTKRIKRNL